MRTSVSRDPYLVDLARQVRSLACSDEHVRRRRLWANCMALRTSRPVVNFYMYRHVWASELAGSLLKHKTGLSGEVEQQLVFQLWRAEHVGDDYPAEAKIILNPCRPPRQGFPWGLELRYSHPDGGGAYKPVPPIRSEEDLDRLVLPDYREDAPATTDLVEQARSLIDDALPVVLHTDELHWGPFEHAVRLRGMDDLLLDVYDRPRFVHRLMDRITTGMVRYHRQREAAGRVSASLGIGHVPHDEIDPHLEQRLKGSWAYCHAQSSASYSPQMYAEFVHPYNCRIADLVGRVYYHGCEDLSRKAKVISTLPNLRLFHISPWTPPEPVISLLGRSVAYEVHSHPTTVILGDSTQAIREELKERAALAAGTNYVLTLADVETFNGRFDRIACWAKAAKEIAG